MMGYFSKKNIFIYCCISACLSLITYLVAFSCEISWILESRGNLPTASYLLCAEYFILFVSSTILVHGLSTGISWGLLSWSIIIGILSIPELSLVMYMTIQYWGLQSTHGLTELISYLIRLIVNCLALMCVIPTALRWRQEKKVLSQLESLASRLQLTTPTPAPPFPPNNGTNSVRASKRSRSSRRPSSGFDNPGYIPQENNSLDIVQQYTAYNNLYGSQSEFNASIFGMNPSQYIGPPIAPVPNECKKTQSLLDLRFIFPPTKYLNNHSLINEKKSLKDKDKDEIDSVVLHNNIKNKINNNLNNNNESIVSAANDPIYYTIESTKNSKILGRNCVSLENLGTLTTSDSPLPHKKNEYNQYRYGNNLLNNYNLNPWNIISYTPAFNVYQQTYLNYPMNYYNYQGQTGQPHQYVIPPQMITGYPPQQPNFSYNNSSYLNSSNNSRQSLGNESDDFRKYRDVAL